MSYKRLFIFVEGDDDERFIQKTMRPQFERKYDSVMFYRYAHQKLEKIDSFIRSLRAMNANYIYMADINRAPCITGKKGQISNRYSNIGEDRIAVVVKEIEGWYLAGLPEDISVDKFRMASLKTTDEVTKEQFNALIPKGFDSRIDFMLEILKFFDIKTAEQKNRSFSYFLKKFC